MFAAALLATSSASSFANSVNPNSITPNSITPNEIPPPNYDDITSSFTQKMRANAAYMAYYALNEKQQGTYPLGTGLEFASKVKGGGPWDYKLQYGWDNWYTYNGRYVKGEDMGNFHYGFVGRASGFGATLLRSIAGAVQIYSGTAHLKWYASYFDDPNDQKEIDYGISMFDNQSWPRTSNSVSALDDVSPLQEELINSLSPEEKEYIKQKVIRDSQAIKEQQLKEGKTQ